MGGPMKWSLLERLTKFYSHEKDQLDLHKALREPRTLREIGDLIFCKQYSLNAGYVCGTNQEAEVIAIATASSCGYSTGKIGWFSLLRDNLEDYKGQKIVLVSDYEYSGKMTRPIIYKCKDAGIEVLALITLLDFENGGVENLKNEFSFDVVEVMKYSEIVEEYKRLNKI